MMRYLKLCVSLLAFLALVACGGGDPTPGGVDVTGTWSGSLIEGGTGSFTMNLTQNGSSVNGDFDGAPLSGTINGSTLSLSDPQGSTITAQVSGNTMNGTLTIVGQGSATFSATRAGGPPGPTPPGPTPPGPTPPGPGPTPPGPGEVNVTGNWLATFEDGSGQFSMNLTQNGASVTGTFTIGDASNSLNGSVSGSNFNATVGGLTIAATVSGTSMNGTVSGQGEGGPFSFGFTAVQQ